MPHPPLRELDQAPLMRSGHAAPVHPSADAVIAVSLDGIITDWNSTAERLYGYNAEEAIGKQLSRLAPPEERVALEVVQARARAGEPVEGIETVLWTSNQHRRNTFLTVSPTFNAMGEIAATSVILRDISAFKAQEQALASSEALLRVAFEQAPIGIMLVGPDFRTLRVNQAMCEMLGYTAEELLATNFWVYTHPDDIPANRDLIERALAGEIDRYELEKRYLHRDGHTVWVHLNGSLIRDDAGAPRYFVSQIQDITARKSADEALAASEERFRIAFADAPIGMALIGANERVVQVNRALCTMLGYSEAELIGTAMRSITHPDDIPANQSLVDLARNGATDSYVLEKRYLRKDGQIVWAALTASCVRDESGAVRYYISQVQDISERRAAELALAASEIRFRTAFESAPTGMALLELSGHYLQVNAALCELTGYSEHELLASTFQAITHPDDLEEDLAHIEELMAGTSRSFQMEKRYIRKDGEIVWVRLSTAVLRDDQGTPHSLISQVEDMTARREAEAALAATHQHTREVLERITDNFYALDDQWRITYVNDATERNFGYSREELLGQNMWERFPQGQDLPFYAAFHEARADGRAQTVEALYPRTDRWYEARAYPSKNGLSVFFRDVTDQKKQQQDLQDALDAAQAGEQAKTRFLAMMSHELRTPLQTIAGNAELLLAGSAGPLTPLQTEDVRAIHSGATRMTTLISQLLELARPVAGGEERLIDPGELLRIVDQVRQDLAPHAEARQLAIRVELPPWLPAVRGDAVRLRQALLNLVSNAVKFTEVGEVCISTEVAGPDVVVTVRDSGIGIPAEALPLIFDEFYQVDSAMTRRYEGAGLGLAIARRLVESMGGTLTVASRPGNGSTFTIRLAAAGASASSFAALQECV